MSGKVRCTGSLGGRKKAGIKLPNQGIFFGASDYIYLERSESDSRSTAEVLGVACCLCKRCR